MPDVLEPQRDILGRAPENCVRQRIRQCDAERADVRGEQLRLHDGVDRRVARHHHERGHHQRECGGDLVRMGESREDRIGEQRTANAEADHQRSPADEIGKPPCRRLDEQHDRQRDGHDLRCRRLVEAARVGEELLEVDRVGVEGSRAAGGDADHQQRFARMIAEQRDDVGPAPALSRGDPLIALGLVEATADKEHDDGEKCTDDEANAPSPGMHRCLAKRRLEKHQQGQSRQLSADDRHVQKARPNRESGPCRRADRTDARGRLLWFCC